MMPACWEHTCVKARGPMPFGVGDVPRRPDPAVGDRAQRQVGRDAGARGLDARRLEPQPIEPRRPADRQQQMRAGDARAAFQQHRDARAVAFHGGDARRPRAAPRPRPASVARSGATHSGSSRPAMVAPSTTVTRQPSRACACAISSPIGPPPMMTRWPGFSARWNRVSFVRKGTSPRPGDGRHDGRRAGGDHRAAEGHAPPGGLDRVARHEAGRGLHHRDAHGGEALHRIIGRDGGDGAMHMRAARPPNRPRVRGRRMP